VITLDTGMIDGCQELFRADGVRQNVADNFVFVFSPGKNP